MGELTDMLTAAAPFVAALGTAAAAVITALRSSPKERRRAARGVVRRLKESAKDGDLTDDEIREALTPDEDDEEDDL